MKCKRIFALVLSLCMVLSTFVAVSAEELVFAEGNDYIIYEDTKTFEADDYNVLVGDGISASLVADPAGERSGKVFGGAITSASLGYIGFEIPAVDAGDVITYSVDVYSTSEWTTSGLGNILVRASSNWPASGSYKGLLAQGRTIPANAWTTIEGTYNVTEDLGGDHLFVQFRPNVEMDGLYLDNFYFKVEGNRDRVLDIEKTCDDASTGVLVAGDSSVTYENGYAVATMAAGHTGTVGIQLIDDDGSYYVPLMSGDTVTFSMDINPSVSFTPGNYTNYNGIILRENGGTAFPAGGTQVKELLPNKAIPADTWTTVKGSYTATTDWTNTGSIALSVRVPAANTVKIDNIKLTLDKKADEAIADSWVAPDYEIPATLVKGTSAASYNFITEDNGAYSFTTEQVATNVPSAAQASQWCLKIIPDQPIPVGTDFKVTYDFLADGVINSIGDEYAEMEVRARCIDNAENNIAQAYTIGYISANAAANTGSAVRVELNSADMTAGGGTSSATEIKMICLVVNMGGACTGYNNEANDGAVTISNIALLENDTKLTFSASLEGGNPVLSIENDQADAYKFRGRMFAAEYDGNLLVQFAEVGNIEREFAAGASTDYEFSFLNAADASNDILIFVWEYDSMTPFLDVIPVE